MELGMSADAPPQSHPRLPGRMSSSANNARAIYGGLMYLADSMNRLDVVLNAEPAGFWQIVAALSPSAALITLVVLAVIALRAMQVATAAKIRAETWGRVAWAVGLAQDEEPARRNAGLAVLDQLALDPFVDKENVAIISQAKAVLKKH